MKKIAYREMYENELTHAWYVATRKLMITFLKKHLRRDTKILDAGCGTGGTIKFLEKAGYKNINGIDNSQESVKYCQKRDLKNILIGSINKLPYKSKTFDVVLCLDVLYHKDVNRKLALKEFNRVLKKGGILYIQEPAFNWLRSQHDLAIHTQHRFTFGEIQNLVSLGGFKILKSSYFNTFLFLPIASKRIFEKILKSSKITSDVRSLPTIINKLMIVILNFEAKLLNFTKLPFGLSIICLARKI